jgi:RNA polymerase sigma-70 factor (ECF subfamily)
MSNDSWPLTRPSLLLRLRDPSDRAAWDTFLDLYGPFLHRFCKGRGLQDADAADVTQEVLLQVHRSIRQWEYRPEKGRFHQWLYKVTRSKFNNFLTSQAARVQAQGGAEANGFLEMVASPDQETAWSEALTLHLLHEAKNRVRPRFDELTWRAFELVWFEKRPLDQVAQELGRTTAWVSVAKSRVKKQLEQVVQELADDDLLFGP